MDGWSVECQCKFLLRENEVVGPLVVIEVGQSV